mgnify:CR=1 FL=1
MNPQEGLLVAIGILVLAPVAAIGFLALAFFVGRHERRCSGCPLCLPR